MLIAAIILMPVIATVAGVKIYMYMRDHNPPHFHAQHGGDEEVFDLEGNHLRGGINRKKGKKVKKWAKENEEMLKDKWDEFQQ